MFYFLGKDLMFWNINIQKIIKIYYSLHKANYFLILKLITNVL